MLIRSKVKVGNVAFKGVRLSKEFKVNNHDKKQMAWSCNECSECSAALKDQRSVLDDERIRQFFCFTLACQFHCKRYSKMSPIFKNYFWVDSWICGVSL
mmetsp:Transcript_55765/g.67019  ORF Transcript_55765/g.67019 Transcript_55765/m.67019 type:complete len:99 (+) Transcript_55765:53-349(+)